MAPHTHWENFPASFCAQMSQLVYAALRSLMLPPPMKFALMFSELWPPCVLFLFFILGVGAHSSDPHVLTPFSTHEPLHRFGLFEVKLFVKWHNAHSPPCNVILTRSLGILDVSRARSNQFSPTSLFGADFDYFVEFYLLLSHHPLWGSDQLNCHLILIVRDCGPHVKSTLGKLRWYLNALLRLVGKKRNSNEIVQRFIEDFNIL